MVKQAACDAASNSSGFVPGSPLKRVPNEYSAETFPLSVAIAPRPLLTSPSQCIVADRTICCEVFTRTPLRWVESFRQWYCIPALIQTHSGATVCFALACALLLASCGPRQPQIPSIRPAPQYRLIDQQNRPISSSQFDGKVQIVTFLFPYCTSYCPLIAAHLVQLEKRFKKAGLADGAELVAFNLDSDGSGPPQMRAFMSQYGWNSRDTYWEYLTGSPKQIRRIVSGGYMVGYQRVDRPDESTHAPKRVNPLARRAHVSYDVIHNDLLEVVDCRGEIREIYDNAEKVPDGDLIRLVRRLEQEE
jgi:protein SCO1